MKEIEPSKTVLWEAKNLSHSMHKPNQESWNGTINNIYKLLNLLTEMWVASLENNPGKGL